MFQVTPDCLCLPIYYVSRVLIDGMCFIVLNEYRCQLRSGYAKAEVLDKRLNPICLNCVSV